MPAATQYLPEDKEQRKIAEDELKERRQRHDEHVRYYRGKHPKSLTVKAGDYDPNVIENLVRQVVNTTVGFVAPDFPKLDIDLGEFIPGEEAEEAPDEIAIDDILTQTWVMNGGIELLTAALTMGAMDGHHFWRVWLDKQGEVRITLVDGGSTIVWWDAHNRNNPLWYEQHWMAGKYVYRQDIVPNTALIDSDEWMELDITNWIVRQYRGKQGYSPMGRTKWELDEEFDTKSSLSPIIDQPYLPDPWAYYGEDDVSHIIQPNNAVNKVSTDVNQILRFHSSPRTIGIGVEAEQIKDSSIDNFWTVPSADANIFNLEMQTDLAASMNYITELRSSLFRTAQVVMLPADPSLFRGITNLAVKMTYGPMINKSRRLQRTYGKAIAEVSARVLDLKGFDAIEPEVIWEDATPVSRVEQLQVAAMELAQGFASRETLQTELGRNTKLEDSRRRREMIIDREVRAGRMVEGQLVA